LFSSYMKSENIRKPTKRALLLMCVYLTYVNTGYHSAMTDDLYLIHSI